ncbi:unnamed protein product [Effrenium voratum]|uniref:Mon2 C-terminal domain-containing protein n=1 Tax=Effrenium voratum TaxID=2562239 RepID=A0AA36JJA6_9DINO|nr:unnamed protein product [Effrenium voratum]
MRFSEAPRPEEVRPLPVLREAFKKTREKWTKDQDWSYVGEMLRSIRQDLTIQMLRDIFVVEVHEYWAQLALEVGDFKQFDQAAVQLQAYYADPTLEKGATKLNEVLAWRLLYLTVEGEGIATTEFLRRNAQRLDFSVPVVKLAWRLRRAISQRCHTKAMHMLAPPKTEGQTGEDDVPPVLPESLRAELLRRVKLAQLMEVCKAVRENMSRSRLESLGLLEDESDPTIQMPIVYQKDDLVDTKATYEEAKKQLEPTLLRENGVGQVRIFRRLGRQRADHLNSFMRNPGKVVVKEEPQEPKPGTTPTDGGLTQGAFAELWAHIFRQLRALASDARPEVRNCAVKSLATALLSHGRKVGPACYQRCLSDILMKIAEMSAARKQGRPAHEAPLIVHHSRDTPEKQWDETLALAYDGVRRVLSHFSEEAGLDAFAPLAYALLLQVQETLETLSPETAASALRALVDLMRIPSSGEAFQVRSLTSDPRLPLQGEWTSVRALSWSLLWHTLNFCLSHELSETFVETLTSSLGALRSSQTCSPVENLILLQFSLVLATAPSWYLASAPWQADDTALGGEPSSVGGLLKEALAEVPAQSDERVHEFIEASPAVLWDLSRRTEGEPLVYSKAPAPVANLVTPNASKSELWSTAALRERPSEELMQSFLSAHTPTHRTMLNISSARLQHVQGIAFGFLEETQSLGVAVEAVLLCQLCAVFLDGHRMVDSNKRHAYQRN